MRRRKFIALLGGAVVLWPLAAHAQERMRRVGVLISGVSDPETQGRHRAFLEAMKLLGWIDGRNLRIDARWAKGSIDGANKYAVELVALAPGPAVPRTGSDDNLGNRHRDYNVRLRQVFRECCGGPTNSGSPRKIREVRVGASSDSATTYLPPTIKRRI